MEIYENFFQITKDDDAYGFAAYACATQFEGDIFVEHDVDDIKLRIRVLKYVNGVTKVEGLDYEMVEGLDDSEDDRVIALVDGFDVTVPINQWEIVAGLLCRPNKKTKDDEYYNDEMDNSDPDESGINVARVRRAQLIAKKIIEGDADKQYANLWRYVAELKRVNLGNTVKINVKRPLSSIQPMFDSLYFCFDGCKKIFINGYKPFIGGCHLKTKYGGQLLIVMDRDPNYQYFPFIFGVVETETKESWRWFLQLLMEDVGQERRYSDVNGDVRPDAHQADNKVDVDNNVVASQTSSCVVDTRHIGLSLYSSAHSLRKIREEEE
ncbi:hypothetical protein KIW84_036037 [Lathyrus oleraceus]|uniref:MULE transposase domain-containing protein n=1 Tax=Pisum sativum TaxID=3888 RepID=A0A9D4Y319_PEA|nr:hypothetical protein KIW84_036037 [Pisum sativum]